MYFPFCFSAPTQQCSTPPNGTIQQENLQKREIFDQDSKFQLISQDDNTAQKVDSQQLTDDIHPQIDFGRSNASDEEINANEINLEELQQNIENGTIELWEPEKIPWVLEDLDTNHQTVLWNTQIDPQTVGISVHINDENVLEWDNKSDFCNRYAKEIIKSEYDIRMLYFVLNVILNSTSEEALMNTFSDTINLSQICWFHWRIKNNDSQIISYADINSFINRSLTIRTAFDKLHDQVFNTITKLLENGENTVSKSKNEIQKIIDNIEMTNQNTANIIEQHHNQLIEYTENIIQQNKDTMAQGCQQLLAYQQEVDEAKNTLMQYRNEVHDRMNEILASAEQAQSEQNQILLAQQAEFERNIDTMRFLQNKIHIQANQSLINARMTMSEMKKITTQVKEQANTLERRITEVIANKNEVENTEVEMNFPLQQFNNTLTDVVTNSKEMIGDMVITYNKVAAQLQLLARNIAERRCNIAKHDQDQYNQIIMTAVPLIKSIMEKQAMLTDTAKKSHSMVEVMNALSNMMSEMQNTRIPSIDFTPALNQVKSLVEINNSMSDEVNKQSRSLQDITKMMSSMMTSFETLMNTMNKSQPIDQQNIISLLYQTLSNINSQQLLNKHENKKEAPKFKPLASKQRQEHHTQVTQNPDPNATAGIINNVETLSSTNETEASQPHIAQETPNSTNNPEATSTNMNDLEEMSTNTLIPDKMSTSTRNPDDTSTNTNDPEAISTNINAIEETSTNTNIPDKTSTNTEIPEDTSTNANNPDESGSDWLVKIAKRLQGVSCAKELTDVINDIIESPHFARYPLPSIELRPDFDIITMMLAGTGVLPPVRNGACMCGFPGCRETFEKPNIRKSHWSNIHHATCGDVNLVSMFEGIYNVYTKWTCTYNNNTIQIAPPNICPFCKDRRFVTNTLHQLKQHMRTTKDKVHQECAALSNEVHFIWALIIAGLRNQEEVSLRTICNVNECYACPYCNQLFSKITQMKAHITGNHRDKMQTVREEPRNVKIKVTFSRNNFITQQEQNRMNSDGQHIEDNNLIKGNTNKDTPENSTNRENNHLTNSPQDNSRAPSSQETSNKEKETRDNTHPKKSQKTNQVTNKTQNANKQANTPVTNVSNSKEQLGKTTEAPDHDDTVKENNNKKESSNTNNNSQPMRKRNTEIQLDNTPNLITEHSEDQTTSLNILRKDEILNAIGWLRMYSDEEIAIPRLRKPQRKKIEPLIRKYWEYEAIPKLKHYMNARPENETITENERWQAIDGMISKIEHDITEIIKQTLKLRGTRRQYTENEEEIRLQIEYKNLTKAKTAASKVACLLKRIREVADQANTNELVRQNIIADLEDACLVNIRNIKEDVCVELTGKKPNDVNFTDLDNLVKDHLDIFIRKMEWLSNTTTDIENRILENAKNKQSLIEKRAQEMYGEDPKRAFRWFVEGNNTPPCQIPIESITQAFAERWQSNTTFRPHSESIWSQHSIPSDIMHEFEERITDTELIEKVIQSRSKQSANGPDGIGYAILQMGAKKSAEMMSLISKAMLKYGKFPSRWNLCRTILLYKSGDPSIINNWRPITLSSCVYRVWACTIAEAIQRLNSEYQIYPSAQKGFIKSVNGCLEHTVMVNEVIAEANRSGRNLYMLTIDLKDAFGSLPHMYIQETLQQLNFSPKFRQIIEQSYAGTITNISVNGKTSSPIQIRKGVKQGCPFSPLLFNMCLNPLIKELETSHLGFQIGNETKTVQAYADDVIVFAESLDAMNSICNIIERFISYSKLEVNPKKCQYFSYILHNNQRSCSGEPIKILSFSGKVRQE